MKAATEINGLVSAIEAFKKLSRPPRHEIFVGGKCKDRIFYLGMMKTTGLRQAIDYTNTLFSLQCFDRTGQRVRVKCSDQKDKFLVPNRLAAFGQPINQPVYSRAEKAHTNLFM